MEEGGWRPPPYFLYKKSIGVLLIFLSLFVFESNRKHHTTKSGGLDELDGLITKPYIQPTSKYSHHTKIEEFGSK
jgi:hypothetical protein